MAFSPGFGHGALAVFSETNVLKLLALIDLFRLFYNINNAHVYIQIATSKLQLLLVLALLGFFVPMGCTPILLIMIEVYKVISNIISTI